MSSLAWLNHSFGDQYCTPCASRAWFEIAGNRKAIRGETLEPADVVD